MKMYVFPRENGAASLELDQDRPWLSPAVDAAIIRLCFFLLAWTAGAGAAAFLALAV